MGNVNDKKNWTMQKRQSKTKQIVKRKKRRMLNVDVKCKKKQMRYKQSSMQRRRLRTSWRVKRQKKMKRDAKHWKMREEKWKRHKRHWKQNENKRQKMKKRNGKHGKIDAIKLNG